MRALVLRAREHAHRDRYRFLLTHALGDCNGVDPRIAVHRDRRRNGEYPDPFGLQPRQRAPQVALGLVAVAHQHQAPCRLRRETEDGSVQRLLQVGGALVDRVRLTGPGLAGERHRQHLLPRVQHARVVAEDDEARLGRCVAGVGGADPVEGLADERRGDAARDVQCVDDGNFPAALEQHRTGQRERHERQHCAAQQLSPLPAAGAQRAARLRHASRHTTGNAASSHNASGFSKLIVAPSRGDAAQVGRPFQQQQRRSHQQQQRPWFDRPSPARCRAVGRLTAAGRCD